MLLLLLLLLLFFCFLLFVVGCLLLVGCWLLVKTELCLDQSFRASQTVGVDYVFTDSRLYAPFRQRNGAVPLVAFFFKFCFECHQRHRVFAKSD